MSSTGQFCHEDRADATRQIPLCIGMHRHHTSPRTLHHADTETVHADASTDAPVFTADQIAMISRCKRSDSNNSSNARSPARQHRVLMRRHFYVQHAIWRTGELRTHIPAL